MKLAVTIDVEEEGLFRGCYPARGATVTNVPELRRLDSLFRDWNIRPTLLLTHAVAAHEPHRDLLLSLRDQWRAEIGAHLHPWNTPPLETPAEPEPVPSERIPRALLEAKLHTLLGAVRRLGVAPVSFRMGRFDIGPQTFGLLEAAGIRVDSSVAPMRCYGSGNHLAAPVEPYFPEVAPSVLEVPLTILPLVRLDGFVPRRWRPWVAKHLASLSAQPMAGGLARLKAAARLHRRRGGRVLTLYFHSSELMPGGCPRHRTEADVERFVGRLREYFAWLHRKMAVEPLTLSELGDLYRGGRRP